jgi:hypothetical protein
MAEAISYTKVGVDDLVAALVNGAHIDGSGNLILELVNSSTINVGPVGSSGSVAVEGKAYARIMGGTYVT